MTRRAISQSHLLVLKLMQAISNAYETGLSIAPTGIEI